MKRECEGCHREVDTDKMSHHYDDFGVWYGFCEDCDPDNSGYQKQKDLEVMVLGR